MIGNYAAVRGILLLLLLFSLASLLIASSSQQDGMPCSESCVPEAKPGTASGPGLVLLQTAQSGLQKFRDPAAELLGADTSKAMAALGVLGSLIEIATPAATIVAQCLVPDVLALIAAAFGFQIFRMALRQTNSQEEKKEHQVPREDEETSPVSPMANLKEDADKFGCTPLHRACHDGNRTEARRLLELRCNIDAREAWDETPLHFAARAGHKEVCGFLLDHRAMLDPVNADDKTPLVVAADEKKEEVCEFLLERGAGVAGALDSELPPMLTVMLCRKLLHDCKASE